MGLGQVFMAMHWGEEYLSGCAAPPASGWRASMRSPRPAFCPSSKQPELKHAAVKVLKAELPWRPAGHGLVAGRPGAGRA
jgi:assimilatory nitrate reductase catalytic subunit